LPKLLDKMESLKCCLILLFDDMQNVTLKAEHKRMRHSLASVERNLLG